MIKLIAFYKNLFTDISPWLKTVFNWFILSAFVGAVTFFIRPDLLEMILSNFAEKFGENPELDMNLALQIFIQNLIASIVALFGGLIFGLGAFVVVVVNGFIIGFVLVAMFFISDNILQTLGLIVGGLIPHGIFELPIFLAAAAFGLRLGIEWLKPEAKGNRLKVLGKNLKQSFIVIPIIILILFIAAVVEVFISGKIVNNF